MVIPKLIQQIFGLDKTGSNISYEKSNGYRLEAIIYSAKRSKTLTSESLRELNMDSEAQDSTAS